VKGRRRPSFLAMRIPHPPALIYSLGVGCREVLPRLSEARSSSFFRCLFLIAFLPVVPFLISALSRISQPPLLPLLCS
jgi:hypothetical protein